MTWDMLKQDLKDKRFHNVYVFWGEEEYAIKQYIAKFKQELVEETYKMFNYIIIEGSDIEANIISNCSTLPMMSEHKMVIVKNSKLFARASKSDDDTPEPKDTGKRDEIIELCKSMPEGVHLFFIEEKVNKTLTLYKRLKEQRACLVEFEYLTPAELQKWVTNEFNQKGIKTNKNDIDYLINYVGNSMQELENEIDKLSNYIGYGNQLNKEHIEKICVQALQSKVFDMLDGISEKNTEKAYNLLKNMLLLKEPIQKINVLVARQFRIMFLVKQLKQKDMGTTEIAKRLKLPPFIVTKTLGQIERYTTKELKNAIKDILGIDCKSKTGRIDPITGLETLIGKYGGI